MRDSALRRVPDSRNSWDAGGFEPSSIGLVLDLLELVEDEASALSLVSGAVERFYRLIGPRWIAGLLLHPSSAVPAIVGDDPRPVSDVRGDLTAWLPRLDIVVMADHDGTRRVPPRVVLDELALAATADACLWAIDTLDERPVVLVAHVPHLAFAQAAQPQDALRRLTGALFAGYRQTRERRARIERTATLSTVLADIVSHLHVDQVLTTIVERARDLLGTDAAYLAEIDEVTRMVTMRVTTGIADAGYKRGTIEVGKGLAGAVAAARQAMRTRDYVVDPRFIHTIETDANVQREGVRGAVMAPLQVGDRVLGVLGVANHRPTDFSDDDVHLIDSLANGAAIALENARLYATQTRLVVQLRELNALTTHQHEALKRSVVIHDQLTELVLQGHGIAVIAERLAILIANPVAVLGPYFNLLVASGLDRAEAVAMAGRLEAGRTEARLAADLARLIVERRPIHLPPDPALEIAVPLILAPIMAGPDLLGYVLTIEAQHEFDPLDFQALEQASTVFALELTRARVVAEVEHRLRGDFVHDLLVGIFDQATIVERAARLGHDLTLPQVILAVAPDAPPIGDQPAPADAQRVEGCQRMERSLRTSFHRRSLVAQTSVIGDVVVALLALPPHVARDRRAGAIVREVRTDLVAYAAPVSASIGVSSVCREPSGLARAYDEARQALRTGQRLGPHGTVTAFDELGIERILLQLPDRHELSRYVEAILGPLVAYDAAHATELLRTLDAYLAAGGHQAATASTLGIHVNSLQYRLRRIREIGKLRLDDPETRLNAQLALRARHTLGAGEVDGSVA